MIKMTEIILKAITSKLGSLISIVLAFFSPIQLLIHMIIMLVIVDMATAIMRNWKIKGDKKLLHKLQTIKSRKLRRSVIKLFLYILFLLCVYLFEVAIFGKSMYMINMASGLLGIVELTSIAENLEIITGKNVFTKIIQKITSKINNWLSDIVDNPEKNV